MNQRDKVAKLLKMGFSEGHRFVGEYVFLWNKATGQKARVYDDARVRVTMPDGFYSDAPEEFLTEKRPSQSNYILASLLCGRALTPLTSLQDFGCMRLAARIAEIKELGYNVVSEPWTFITYIGQSKTVARYYIAAREIQ